MPEFKPPTTWEKWVGEENKLVYCFCFKEAYLWVASAWSFLCCLLMLTYLFWTECLAYGRVYHDGGIWSVIWDREKQNWQIYFLWTTWKSSSTKKPLYSYLVDWEIALPTTPKDGWRDTKYFFWELADLATANLSYKWTGEFKDILTFIIGVCVRYCFGYSPHPAAANERPTRPNTATATHLPCIQTRQFDMTHALV